MLAYQSNAKLVEKHGKHNFVMGSLLFLFLLITSFDAFADKDRICLQNVSSSMMSLTIDGFGNVGTTAPAKSGANWGDYCFGMWGVNGIHVLSGDTSGQSFAAISVDDPLIGAPSWSLDGPPVSVNGQNYQIRLIYPGGNSWVVKVCDPDQEC